MFFRNACFSRCYEEEANVDDDGEPVVENGGAGGSNGAGGGSGGRDGQWGGKKGGKFMEGVPGVSLFTLQVQDPWRMWRKF